LNLKNFGERIDGIENSLFQSMKHLQQIYKTVF